MLPLQRSLSPPPHGRRYLPVPGRYDIGGKLQRSPLPFPRIPSPKLQQRQQQQQGMMHQQHQQQHFSGAKDGSQEEDMIAGLDAFAPVTFDAGTLFKRPPFETPEGTPDSPYYPDGVRSPLEYMATFSEVRRKYSSSKAMEEAAAAAAAAAKAGSDHAGGHWFLSKVK
ncbi:hypothetical protein GGI11_002229, partial [Coemansia sp. RSA 2049]